MNKKLYRNIGIMAGILFLAAIGVALYMFYKPHRNIAAAQADYTLTATELYHDFKTNEAAANKKYLAASQGKVIQVSGIIKEINHDRQGGVSLVLNDLPMLSGGINCSIRLIDKEKAGKLRKGVRITVKGECTGYMDITDEVTLINCVLM